MGNVLTILVTIGAIFAAFYRFSVNQAVHSERVTTALDNQSSLIDGLQQAVKIQNGRLASVETKMAVREGVDAALALLGHHPVKS